MVTNDYKGPLPMYGSGNFEAELPLLKAAAYFLCFTAAGLRDLCQVLPSQVFHRPRKSLEDPFSLPNGTAVYTPIPLGSIARVH